MVKMYFISVFGIESSDLNFDGLCIFICKIKHIYLIAWFDFLPKTFYFIGP